ncbi:MAG: sensor histidine kinase [Anaerolineales bacterium]|nr:sensor histidine kinase [Anaerolineales bacterium]
MRPGDETAQRDVWEWSRWIWVALFYGVLIIVVAIALNDTANAGMHGRILGLSTVLAAWHGVALVAAFRFNGYERPWLMTLLVAVGAAIWFLLAQIDPFFYFLLSGLFPFVYIFLPLPWAIGMTLVINALAAIDNTGGGDRLLDLYNPALWYWLGFSVVAILMGAWIYAIIRQSMQRRVLIEQLQAAQAQLAAAERREGMLQERERLARDIHDTLAQGFTSIVMHLEAAEQALPGDLATLRHHLDTARDTARASLTQARQVVHDLRPELLARQSLPAAIERVVSRWAAQTGIHAAVACTGSVLPLHPEVDVTLLRALQEALANVRKHAQAGEVRVTLSYMGDVVVLDVADDGVGINGAGAPSPYAGGFGLQAMRERVAQLGGTVALESEPGEGTTLAVTVPVGTR